MWKKNISIHWKQTTLEFYVLYGFGVLNTVNILWNEVLKNGEVIMEVPKEMEWFGKTVWHSKNKSDYLGYDYQQGLVLTVGVR